MKVQSKITAVKQIPKSYGSLNLSSRDFPAVANLKLGSNQKFEITVTVEGLRSPDRWEVSENKANPKDVYAQVRIDKINIEDEVAEGKGEEAGEK